MEVKITSIEITWYKNGLIHRDNDLPAVVRHDYLMWYQYGKKHRNGDKPAVIARMDESEYRNVSTMFIHYKDEYYINDKLHRDNNLPAVVDIVRNSLEWHVNGELHRDGDLPAVIMNNCAKYVRNGKLHREGDLPAFIYRDGNLRQEEIVWYYDGKHFRGEKPVAYTKNVYAVCSITRRGDKVE